MAGDDGEVGDRLEHVQVVGGDLALVQEADRERAAQLAAPAHRHADAGAHAGQRRLAHHDILAVVVAVITGPPVPSTWPAMPSPGPSR